MDTKKDRIKKDIESLARFTATEGNGLTRFTYTKEHADARDYIKSVMEEAGLLVYEDSIGSIFGRLEGEDTSKTIIIGSHFDSVKNGGNFDGQAGVVIALEIARVFKEQNLKPKYSIEFVAMVEEEGGRFGGGLFASRVMCGRVNREELDNFKDKDGVSIANAMKNFGLDPEKLNEAIRDKGSIEAFLELHIEQGPILEKNEKDIGIVNYIVGLTQLEIEVFGRADHAGTTPMNMRMDALDAILPHISKISSFAKEEGEGTVATIGVFEIKPGAANVVPNYVKFTIDVRSKNKTCIENVIGKIKNELKDMQESRGNDYKLTIKTEVSPVKMDEEIFSIFEEKARMLNLSTEVMLSGAGHDAMVMASIAKSGLIFVKSKEGRSHCKDEWTDYEDLNNGAELMLETLKQLSGL